MQISLIRISLRMKRAVICVLRSLVGKSEWYHRELVQSEWRVFGDVRKHSSVRIIEDATIHFGCLLRKWEEVPCCYGIRDTGDCDRFQIEYSTHERYYTPRYSEECQTRAADGPVSVRQALVIETSGSASTHFKIAALIGMYATKTEV